MNIIIKISKSINYIFITILLGITLYYSTHILNKLVVDKIKIKISKKKIILILLTFTTLYICYKLYVNYSIIKELVFTIFISLIISYVLNPFVNYLELRNIKRLWGVTLVYISLILVLALTWVLIFPPMIKEIKNLTNDLPVYFEQLNKLVNKVYNFYTNKMDNLPDGFSSIKDTLDSNVGNIQVIATKILSSITDYIFKIASKIIHILLIPVITFYFLKDKEYFKKKIITLIPRKHRKSLLLVCREINIVISSFIRGQLMVALFIGVTTTIGLYLLKIKFAFIIGFIAGIFNVIPYFGPIIGVIPAILFALLDNPIKVIWVTILFILIQQFEGDILTPKIVGKTVGIHPITVMMSILIGGSIFGILGMILAVPITAVLIILINFTIDEITKI